MLPNEYDQKVDKIIPYLQIFAYLSITYDIMLCMLSSSVNLDLTYAPKIVYF